MATATRNINDIAIYNKLKTHANKSIMANESKVKIAV